MEDHTTHAPQSQPYFPADLENYPKWVAKFGLLAPYGKCQCGCNESAHIANQRDHRTGAKKGQYLRFLRGHHRRIRFGLPAPNPSGLCMCGCGQKTSIARKTDLSHGWTQGQPTRYLIGHQNRRDEIVKFWTFVDKREPDECWLWQGSKVDGGYGRCAWQGKIHHSSRVSYIIHFGDIPDGMLVCHNCPGGDNPACVNPAHLWLGTHQANMDDKVAKGRQRRGEDQGNAKLTENQVTEIRQRHAAGNITQRALATQYGVSQKTIMNVVKRVAWSHVP